MSNEQSAYPLSWPQHRKRTNYRDSAPFGPHSINDCTYALSREISLLGARRFVISTDIELRQDGLPYSNQKAPADPGAAVYFDLKGKPVVMACDKWNKVEHNLWAIVKHIEAIRGTTRWGVGELAQAFAGYTALPPPADMRPWYDVLGVKENCTLAEARAAWIEGAKKFHPDSNGGDHKPMAVINGAWTRAQEVCT
jgi:DnaJ-like protein